MANNELLDLLMGDDPVSLDGEEQELDNEGREDFFDQFDDVPSYSYDGDMYEIDGEYGEDEDSAMMGAGLFDKVKKAGKFAIAPHKAIKDKVISKLPKKYQGPAKFLSSPAEAIKEKAISKLPPNLQKPIALATASSPHQAAAILSNVGKKDLANALRPDKALKAEILKKVPAKYKAAAAIALDPIAMKKKLMLDLPLAITTKLADATAVKPAPKKKPKPSPAARAAAIAKVAQARAAAQATPQATPGEPMPADAVPLTPAEEMITDEAVEASIEDPFTDEGADPFGDEQIQEIEDLSADEMDALTDAGIADVETSGEEFYEIGALPKALKKINLKGALGVAKKVGPLVAAVYPPAAPAIAVALKVADGVAKGQEKAKAKVAAIKAKAAGTGPEAETAREALTALDAAQEIRRFNRAAAVVKDAQSGSPAAAATIAKLKVASRSDSAAAAAYNRLNDAARLLSPYGKYWMGRFNPWAAQG